MSLRELTLQGINQSFQATAKDFAFSASYPKRSIGERLRKLTCFTTLASAHESLVGVIAELKELEEANCGAVVLRKLRRKLEDWLQAVESTQSRAGINADELVENLLTSNSMCVEEAASSNPGFSLYQGV